MPRVTRDWLTLAPAPMGPRIKVESIDDKILKPYVSEKGRAKALADFDQYVNIKVGTIFKNFKIFNIHNKPADLIVVSVDGEKVVYREHGNAAGSPEWVTTRRKVLEWVNQGSL